MERITVEDIMQKKSKEKITMLTCYDYSFTRILDEAGVDIILVGDSLANVVLGLEETRRVSFSEMLNHTKAVSRGVKHSLVVADMPYVSYQKNPEKCVYYAEKFIAAGADAVKVEWFFKKAKGSKFDGAYVVKKLIKAKIAVMGHIGLTPQTAHLLGGYKVQGRDRKQAEALIRQAKVLEDLGAFGIVLECTPYQLGRVITQKLKIPTIGIGAGRHCDGQVLVLYDLLGLYKKIKPKFVRVYHNLYGEIKECVIKFIGDVKDNNFPSIKESFSSPQEEEENMAKKH